MPCLLLLEDDPVSARFLFDALQALPARIRHATTLAGAEAIADATDALWVFDVRLPDGHAADLLPRLRARGLRTPAIALTADVDDRTRRRLQDAGFAAVLGKPIPGDQLREAVRRNLGDAAGVPPDWDDRAAAATLGDAAAVQALRKLFLGELPEQRRRVHAACRDGEHATAGELLHRLKAACGFVGATALQAAVRDLQAEPGDARALARFEACAAALVDR